MNRRVFMERAAQGSLFASGLPLQTSFTSTVNKEVNTYSVAVGWETIHQTLLSDTYDLGNPFSRIFTDNQPELFIKASCKAKDYCWYHPEPKNIVLVNEWTEGSYLEPDQVNGPAYLKALKSIFNPQ